MNGKQIVTECYKCSAKTDSYEDAVHPLCDKCHVDFEQWMWSQLKMIGGKNG